MGNLTKDERLIRDNPELTAYDLLNKGLSQAGYEKLLATQEANVTNEIKQAKKQPVTPIMVDDTFHDLRQNSLKVAPTVTKDTTPTRAMPKTQEYAPVDINGDMAILVDTVKGTRTPMMRSFAVKWATKSNHKGRYKVE